jgi:predicted phage-related endonuclease
MAVVRIRPLDQGCGICGARSRESHENIHDCLAAIDREMQVLLKKTKSLSAQRRRLMARQIAGIQKKAREIDQRVRARTRPRSA